MGAMHQRDTWAGSHSQPQSSQSQDYFHILLQAAGSHFCTALLQLRLPAAPWSTFPHPHPLPSANLVTENLSQNLSFFLAAILNPPNFPPTQTQ